MSEEKKKSSRGGHRPGSGRKRSGKKGKTYSFYLNPEQYELVKKFIESLRKLPNSKDTS